MDVKTYMLGESIVLGAELYDSNELPADASAIRLLILPPNLAGSIVVALTSAGLNKVSGIFVPSFAGLHRYRFESTSGLGAAAEGSFIVEPRQVPPPT